VDGVVDTLKDVGIDVESITDSIFGGNKKK
jgi:hypothetical protein